MNIRQEFSVASMALAVVALLLGCLLPSAQTEVIQVSANATLDSNSSLEYYICEAGDQLPSGTTLQLSRGTHTLGRGPFCLLQNLANITIQGQTGSETATLIYCEEDIWGRGIAFFNMTNLQIKDVLITNCGMEIPSGLPGHVNDTFAFLGPLQKAVLLFTHCTDMVMESVTIGHCYGFGMIVINPLGTTLIKSVSVSDTDNRAHILCFGALPRFDLSCSGSGAVFLYADTEITQLLDSSEPNSSLATLNITECSFLNNYNTLPSTYFNTLFSRVRIAFVTEPIVMSGASALAVYLGQLGYFVDVYIVNSTVERNVGDFGGVVIAHYNSIRNSKTRIYGTTVANNRATQSGLGGGLLIGFIMYFDFLNSFPDYPNDVFEIIEIRSSVISDNCAQTGGGIYVHLTPQNVSDIRIIVRDTEFSRNVAQHGSAINSYVIRSTVISKAVHFLLEDVEASENTYPDALMSAGSPENTGVFMFVENYNITIEGTEGKGSYFHDNSVSVFLISGANVILQGNVSFEKNIGFRGGALNLFDNALLFLYEGSVLRFEKNSAVRLGGAIYINTLASGVNDACVIQVLGMSQVFLNEEELQLLNLTVIFSENSAGVASNSIYGNPLYNCFYLPETSVSHEILTFISLNSEFILYDTVFQFPSTVSNGLAEINSDPFRVCICKNSTFVREDCFGLTTTIRDIIPGQTFELYLNPIDTVSIPVTSLLYSELEDPLGNSSAMQLGPGQDIQQLPGLSNCTPVQFNVFAPENSLIHLKLFATPGGQRSTVIVNMTSCPPGFSLAERDGRLQCVCSSFVENDLQSACNLTTYTIARPENSWVGTVIVNGTLEVVYVPTCPINYCNEGVVDVDLRISDQLCVEGRTGVLCGTCRDGLSTIFGSAKCKKCSNAWLGMIVVFALVGPLFVFLLFLLDLTVTHGTINGLIFYANIVSVNANIFFRGTGQGFLFVFLSLLNLELGFPLCFFDGMDELAKVGLQYIFPSYLLLIGGGIILLSKYSRLMQKILSRHAGLQVLTTMLYLSYSKILRSVIDTFTYVARYGERTSELIWFFDGNVEFLSGVHIFLFILAIATLLFFVLPYIFVLTFSRLIQRFRNSTRFSARLDANLAPYKDKLRFWFGARLILILILYIIFSNLGTNDPSLALILQLSFIISFAFVQAFIRPFKSLAVELLDMFFIVNLCFILLGTISTMGQRSKDDDQDIQLKVFLALAFIVACGIFGFHIMKTLWKIPFLKEKAKKLAGKSRETYEMTTHKLKTMRASGQSEGPDAQTVAGDSGNRGDSPSYITIRDMVPAPDNEEVFSELREPVLEFVKSQRHTA